MDPIKHAIFWKNLASNIGSIMSSYNMRGSTYRLKRQKYTHGNESPLAMCVFWLLWSMFVCTRSSTGRSSSSHFSGVPANTLLSDLKGNRTHASSESFNQISCFRDALFKFPWSDRTGPGPKSSLYIVTHVVYNIPPPSGRTLSHSDWQWKSMGMRITVIDSESQGRMRVSLQSLLCVCVFVVLTQK